MDAMDHFLDAELYPKHRHRHFFTDGETLDQRRAWLHSVKNTCQAAQTSYVVRETMNDRGQPGYEFGFASKESHMAFRWNIYGDQVYPAIGDQVYIHRMAGVSSEYKRAFLLAAEAHLGVLGINHHWREQDGNLEFSFEKFSDQATFEVLAENGTIDAAAQGLEQALLFRKKLGLDPVGPHDAPGMNL